MIMVNECKLKSILYEYLFSFAIIGCLLYLKNNFVNLLPNFLLLKYNSILKVFFKEKSLIYFKFLILILGLICDVTFVIFFMRLLTYCFLYLFYSWNFRKNKIYKIYEKNILSFDTIMYTIIWILYCVCVPYPYTHWMKGISIFSSTVTNFIMIYTGAAVLWCIYIKTCAKTMKENCPFYYNSNFLFVFAKIIRPILVATVAWVAIVVNFILNYKLNDSFEKISVISSVLNNLVTLCYPIIDIFTFVYSEIYKN